MHPNYSDYVINHVLSWKGKPLNNNITRFTWLVSSNAEKMGCGEKSQKDKDEN